MSTINHTQNLSIGFGLALHGNKVEANMAIKVPIQLFTRPFFQALSIPEPDMALARRCTVTCVLRRDLDERLTHIFFKLGI